MNSKIDSRVIENGQRSVELAWENFLSDDKCPTSDVRKVIELSWQRSVKNGVQPTTLTPSLAVEGDSLDHLRHVNQDMRSALHRVGENLADILDQINGILMLADSNGVLVDVFGCKKLLGSNDAESIAPGFVWAETNIGTNAIGTAIELKQPVEIHAAEHFCELARIWSCSAAPIFDYLDGELLGIIDVTTLSEKYSSRNIALAITAAQQIQQKLWSQDLRRHTQLVDWFHESKSRWKSDGVILLDRKGRNLKTDENAQNMLDGAGVEFNLTIAQAVAAAGDEPTLDTLIQALPETTVPVSLVPYSSSGPWQGGALVLSSCSAFKPRLNHVAKDAVDAFTDIVSCSQIIEDVIDRARRFATTDAPVLIQGETGCGKELFANAIHKASAFADGPFVAINCGMLTSELASSELFGYEGGAFTGANSKGRKGKFEEADGGTLFLDEIGELPTEVQVILLRTLQDGVVVRVGSNKQRKVSTRIVAATNRNLGEEVEHGKFRADLYFRLKVMTLCLPPLREIPEDINVLAESFIHEFASHYGCSKKLLEPQLITHLQRYSWPGNTRELRGVLESMFVLSDAQTIESQNLPEEILSAFSAPAFPQKVLTTDPGSLCDIERSAIIAEIERHQGNLSQVAQQLGIARSTLYRKLHDYQIDRSSHR